VARASGESEWRERVANASGEADPSRSMSIGYRKRLNKAQEPGGGAANGWPSGS
jgi:hypothetical protein